VIRAALNKVPFAILDCRRTRGFHLLNDLRYWLRGVDAAAVVLDVGANVGKYAIDFHRRLGRDVFAFEPVAATFAELKANVGSFPRIQAIKTAVGAESGTAEIAINPESSLVSSLRPNTKWHSKALKESVPVTTIDAFLEDRRRPRVAVLKIDVEGFEKEVLAGAKNALAERAVDFLVLETAFISPKQQPRVTMTDLIEALGPYGYEPWGLYDYEHVRRDRGGISFMNAVFGQETRDRE
jgi:FkbM family methyltransferase